MKNLNEKDVKTSTESEYGYYSKLLQKPFDSLVELKKAEKEELDAREAKRLQSETKKSDAHKVEDAFKKYNAAKAKYDEKILEARKVCAQKIAEAKKEYAEEASKYQDELEKAESEYSKSLKEFTDKHPEGYHMTLKDGDNVTTIERSTHSNLLGDFYSSVLKFLDF